MFTDINLFKIDQQKFYEELKELNEIDDDSKDKNVKELNDKFRDKIRKYLPTCLNIINTNFKCQYSLYKVGKDFDASFKVIETNVKKTRDEVENELNYYKNMSNYNNMDESTKEQIELACEILITYVDDSYGKDINKLVFLERAKAKTSSIINNVPRMSPEALSNNEVQEEIQYNPYANQPVNLDNEFTGSELNSNSSINNSEKVDMLNSNNTDSQDNSNFSMNIFYGNGQ